MRNKVSEIAIEERWKGKFLNVPDACLYYDLGRNALRKLSDSVGATRKIGRRVLIDRTVIDEALAKSDITL